jgi:cobalt-zinc-cadmium efflux system membrane fusion protein
MALISAPVAGVVESVKCNVGDFVNKGQTLALLSGRELILVQKEFAETAARYHRLGSDYRRSKALFEDHVGSEKDLLALESEYTATKAGYHSLKRRLELLRLDPAKVETGEIYSAFPLTSPIRGYVTNLSLVLGQYAEPQAVLAEIVDISQLQLKLSVFEKDVYQLKPGQRVRFRSLGSKDSLGEALLITVGQAIQPESRTISCMAGIQSANGGNYINNLFVEAEIIVKTQEAPALPDEAVIKAGKEYYVFVVEKSDGKSYSLKKVKVKTGRSSGGFTEILDGDNLGKVLVKGAYNLSAE